VEIILVLALFLLLPVLLLGPLQLLVVVVVVVAPTTALILPARLARISLCPKSRGNKSERHGSGQR